MLASARTAVVCVSIHLVLKDAVGRSTWCIADDEHAPRFIDADYVQQITRRHISCSLDDTQAAQLPPPQGSPVYHVDALADSGHSLHDILGRLFRRPHWIREDDQA